MSQEGTPRYLDAFTCTWEEAKIYLQKCPAAILPLGATEQHGPHLPQGTDTILAWEICRRVAERTAGYLLPPIPITYSWVWRNFTGSIWISTTTLVALVKEIVVGLERQGLKAMLIVTGHGANQVPLKYAVRELMEESKVAILYTALYEQAKVVQEMESRFWRGPYELHAEELETSLMLALRPELVQMHRAVKDYPPIPEYYGHTAISMGDLARTGVFGDATLASADKGVRWLEMIVNNLSWMWHNFLRKTGIEIMDYMGP